MLHRLSLAADLAVIGFGGSWPGFSDVVAHYAAMSGAQLGQQLSRRASVCAPGVERAGTGVVR